MPSWLRALVKLLLRHSHTDSTLGDGEQFATAFFDTNTKIQIAKALDSFGAYEPRGQRTVTQRLRNHLLPRLKAKILTHVRCHMDDARVAVECGVDGVNLVIGTSSFLRTHGHGKDIPAIIKIALEVIEFVKSKGLEVRFSSEDSFRTSPDELLHRYTAVDRAGVGRVGVADTVGCATPRQVYDFVRMLRGIEGCDIETHFHNDPGCAVANALCAIEAGATHIETCVLGIRERNGITSLGALMARTVVMDRAYIKGKYELEKLQDVEAIVARAAQVDVPFNNCITDSCAFTHKAGIHAKVMLANPSTYKIINPADFGVTRCMQIASRLTGWNAIKGRCHQLKVQMTDAEIKQCTARIKALANVRQLTVEDTDFIIRTFSQASQCNSKPGLFAYVPTQQKQTVKAVVVA